MTCPGIVTIRPHEPMIGWPAVDRAVRTIDHVKLSLYAAALRLLAGSLGGRANDHDLARRVRFHH